MESNVQGFQFFVGIDWGAEIHEARLISADEKVDRPFVAKNRSPDIVSFVETLAKAAPPEATAVGIEMRQHILIAALLAKGFSVFHLNPMQADRFRDRYSPSRAKSDELDALVLASALRTDLKCFRPVNAEPLARTEIVALLEQRDLAQTERQKFVNRVLARLRVTFPELIEIGSAYTRRWVRAVIAAFPTPALARTATSELLKPAMKRSHRKHADKVLTLLHGARSILSEAQERIEAEQIRMLLESAEHFDALVARCERRIETAVAALVGDDEAGAPLSDVRILQSLPGVGTIVCAGLYGYGGAAFDQHDLAQLRCLSGVAPVTRKSGKQGRPKGPPQHVSMRRAVRGNLRETIFHLARVTISRDEPSRAYYATLRARSKTHAAALRRVGDRVLRTLAAMLARRELFRPRPTQAPAAGSAPPQEMT